MLGLYSSGTDPAQHRTADTGSTVDDLDDLNDIDYLGCLDDLSEMRVTRYTYVSVRKFTRCSQNSRPLAVRGIKKVAPGGKRLHTYWTPFLRSWSDKRMIMFHSSPCID